jgi:hypothetical protein
VGAGVGVEVGFAGVGVKVERILLFTGIELLTLDGIFGENLDFKFVGSKNLFVNIDNKQYLLCINEYNFMVELYEVNNYDNNKIWSFKTFFNLVKGGYLSYFSYEIFELPTDSTYIIVFIPKETEDYLMSSAIFIKKFKLYL